MILILSVLVKNIRAGSDMAQIVQTGASLTCVLSGQESSTSQHLPTRPGGGRYYRCLQPLPLEVIVPFQMPEAHVNVSKGPGNPELQPLGMS